MTKDQRHRHGLSEDEYFRLTGFKGDWRDGWWDDAYLNMMTNEWNLESIESILDVGSGIGHWGQRLLEFLPKKTRLVGIDAEVTWASKAHERATQRGWGERTRYETGPAEQLPFPDNTFDLVTCQTLLIHVKEPEPVIQEMIRVLKPGGLFLAAEPNNFATAAGKVIQNPGLDWAQAQGILELEFRLGKGKAALGEGDASIGQYLPKYLQECGLEQIQTRLNNNCAYKVPPYERTFDAFETKMLQDAQDSDNAMCLGGNYENALRFFTAGGGTETRFTELWQQLFEFQRSELEMLNQNRYYSGGGFIHYLQWGRKPQP